MSVITATMKSRSHIPGDIERGVKNYKKGGVIVKDMGNGLYHAEVPLRNGEMRRVTLTLTRDKRDIKESSCYCTRRYKNPPLCSHVVAAVLEIQGGVADSPLAIGKSAGATAVVDSSNTAATVGSGSLNVFGTPMMIALMEAAACNCLSDALQDGETSVGTKINVEHIAASATGATIIATARVERVFGNRVEFTVEAFEDNSEKKIGFGTHTRVIVDEERFMGCLKK
jgi:predicted thioesterase